jgi:HAD superfamily hydrolase (TIGR01459 family)
MEIMIDCGLSRLAANYDVLLCDIWGVLHDGSCVFREAAEALIRFRKMGGTVILVSNASRLSTSVGTELTKFGMPFGAYDGVVTSGDIAREIIASNPAWTIFDVGPADGSAFLSGLNVRFSTLEEANIAVTSGAFSGVGDPENLRHVLIAMSRRNLLLLCANPDLVTYIAARYAELGGNVLRTGKPERLIYQRALQKASEIREGSISPHRVLAIGDAIQTDVAGAAASGLDSLFVTDGIHKREINESGLVPVQHLFEDLGFNPTAIAHKLHW